MWTLEHTVLFIYLFVLIAQRVACHVGKGKQPKAKVFWRIKENEHVREKIDQFIPCFFLLTVTDCLHTPLEAVIMVTRRSMDFIAIDWSDSLATAESRIIISDNQKNAQIGCKNTDFHLWVWRTETKWSTCVFWRHFCYFLFWYNLFCCGSVILFRILWW